MGKPNYLGCFDINTGFSTYNGEWSDSIQKCVTKYATNIYHGFQ